jgi:hypothetical protein
MYRASLSVLYSPPIPSLASPQKKQKINRMPALLPEMEMMPPKVEKKEEI